MPELHKLTTPGPGDQPVHWPSVFRREETTGPARLAVAAERLADIQAPTIIMTADHDIPACLEIADLLTESVPDSRKVVMEDTGHLLHMEQPEEFNRHVIEFVKSVELR